MKDQGYTMSSSGSQVYGKLDSALTNRVWPYLVPDGTDFVQNSSQHGSDDVIRSNTSIAYF